MKQGSFERCSTCMDRCYCVDRMPGYIYFVRSQNRLIKIGYTEHFPRRIRSLKNSSAGRIRVVKVVRGNRIIEGKLHEAFREYRRHGEWFVMGPRIVEFLSTLGDRQTIFIHDCNLLLANAEPPG